MKLLLRCGPDSPESTHETIGKALVISFDKFPAMSFVRFKSFEEKNGLPRIRVCVLGSAGVGKTGQWTIIKLFLIPPPSD